MILKTAKLNLPRTGFLKTSQRLEGNPQGFLKTVSFMNCLH